MSTKKKTAKKAAPKQPTITVKEYGHSVMASPMLRTLFGEHLPEDPAQHAEFWKKKYEDQCQKTATQQEKVALLRSIIDTALRSGGSRDSDY